MSFPEYAVVPHNLSIQSNDGFFYLPPINMINNKLNNNFNLLQSSKQNTVCVK